jgi:hypothetical protein
VNYVYYLTLKDGFVYFTDNADDTQEFTSGHLSKVAVTGGPPTVLVRPPPVAVGKASELTAMGVAVGGGSVFWTDGAFSSGNNRLMKTPIEGGDSVEVWKGDGTCSIGVAPAIDGDSVYWLASCSSALGMLMTVPAAGGTPTMLGSGNDPQWQPFQDVSVRRNLAVANGFAVWTQPTGRVVSLPLADPSTAYVLTEAREPTDIVFAGEQAIFTDTDYLHSGEGAVYSIAPGVTFTSSVPLLPSAQVYAWDGLAVDEAFAYFALPDSIQRVPLGGGDAVTVVSSRASPRALAVDDTSVFWVEDTGIWRAPKSPP